MRIKSYALRASLILGLIVILCFSSTRLFDYKLESWRTGGWSDTPEVYRNQVQRLEWATEPPNQKITFWCDANRTVDTYIMTEEQYQVLTTANTEPTEYVYHYTGQKINVTFITNLKGAVNYNFVAYPKTDPILIYNEGMVTEHQTLDRHLDSRYLVLDLFAVAMLLYLTIYPYHDDEVIQTKSS